MPIGLTITIRKEINRLQKSIAQKTSELVSLRNELKKHERIYKLLGAERRRGRAVRRRATRTARVNWDLVLKRLPNSFTLPKLSKRKALRAKAKGYLRQVVVKWAKQGKVKRTGRGRYRKA